MHESGGPGRDRFSHRERHYLPVPLAELTPDAIGSLPAVIDSPQGGGPAL